MLEKHIEIYWNSLAGIFNEYVQGEMACKKKQAWKMILRKYAGTAENTRILDVGTGPGFFAILLAEMDYSVTAIDKCDDMLTQARQNAASAGQAIHFLKADAHAAPFPAESFDLIVSRNVTWLLPNPLAVYQEWHRLLKPAGKVLVFDTNWFLRLSDPELKLQCDKYRQLAIKKGYKELITPEQQDESDDIARKLPLTYEKRPSWDEQAFCRSGFHNIIIQENINELIYDEIEQILYRPTPMFAICASK
ncbi:class I SAM-dependent methyltransferase [Methylomusa anaerophila]|uniref:Demethylmenaquinone methyltransferase n=1 Tax=Methylomusa anaerophila TaxID=1930071 RepID=A0A348AE70_9FIRM|nr:class I SAM-dependent methyltransferase [Methylomusa anaerophila]BBB89368.1 demethylmenaquinone methyltransferase [Methylomusa anaerophila]